MANLSRIIFHIDMNSYFATCEQQANPHLRGLPIGVCEHLGGIIIAPSIEAKRLGIKTGTPVWEARKIDPLIGLLPVDPPKYREITRRFLRIFSDYTSLVERYSIDEAFLDVTNLIGAGEYPWSTALLYALEIKQRIRLEIGEWLSCSIGAAPNKLLAKIASDMEKPDGLTLIKPEDIPGLYERLNLTDIPGIAYRMERRLHDLGIFSLSDLRDYPEEELRQQFGIVGHYLHELGALRNPSVFELDDDQIRIIETEPHPLKFEAKSAEAYPPSPRATADDPLRTDVRLDIRTYSRRRIKSMGHAYTMPAATDDPETIRRLIFKLSEKVGKRLRARSFAGSVVSCYVRYATRGNGESSGEGRGHRIHDLISDGRDIFRAAWKIYQSFHNGHPVRMAGVTVSGLAANVADEPPFERYRRAKRVIMAMDRVNDKYGDFFLRRAFLLQARALASDTVGFGRMKA